MYMNIVQRIIYYECYFIKSEIMYNNLIISNL